MRFGANLTTTRTYNLGISTLGVDIDFTLSLDGATVNGGYLAGPGTIALGNNAALNSLTTLISSNLTQGTGTVATLNNATIRGTLTQSGGTLNFNNGLVLGSGQLNISGTVNTTGTEIQGVSTINGGGTLANTGTSLYLTGGSRTTINSGGTLSTDTTNSGSTIELNDALLVNNGTQTGTLDVNYGSTAEGSGTFGNVVVNTGGQFGTNSVDGSSLSVTLCSIRLTAGDGLVVTGPQLNAAPGTTNVGSLTLHGGGTFTIRVQDAAGAAGTGYDLTHAGSTLTLASDASATNQILISLSSLDSSGNPGSAANFNPNQNHQFVLVEADGGILGYSSPAEFDVDTAGFENATDGGSFSVVEQGNELVLDFMAVPEPGTWTLLAVAMAGTVLGVARRNFRRGRQPA